MVRTTIDYMRSFFDYAGTRALTAYLIIFAAALLDGVGLALLVPVLELLINQSPTGYTKQVVDYLSAFGVETVRQQLLFFLGGFLVLLFVRSILSWQRSVRIQQLGRGFVDSWRERLFKAMANASWSRTIQYQRTDLEHALLDDVGRLAVGTSQMLSGTVLVFMIVVQMGISFVLSAQLTLAILGFICVASLLLVPSIARARILGDKTTRTGRDIQNVLGQFMTGLKLAKAHNAHESFAGRFIETVDAQRKADIQFSSSHSKARAIFQFMSGLVVCLVIVVGVFVLETPYPVLIVVLIIMARLTGPFLSLVQSAQMIANMLPAYEALKEKLTDFSEVQLAPERPVVAGASDTALVKSSPPRLELQNIRFHHHHQAHAVLNNVSLVLEPGSLSVFVGESGAGKSTLIDIIIGLLKPQSGKVVIEGKDTTNLQLGEIWGNQMAYLPQDSFLFDVSVRQNLVWPEGENGETVADDAIWRALELAGAYEFVARAPLQLDERAGERGQMFSGGERQRLCLARALLRNPKILILDEATNAVDVGLEKELLGALAKLKDKMTIIVVSHRPASVLDADNVFELRGGNVRRLSPAID